MSPPRIVAGLALLLACAPHAVPVDETPPCPKDMALVPGGSRDGVTMPPFCLDRLEVTAGQYGACMIAGACPPPNIEISESCGTYDAAAAAYPVNCIDFHQADAYCQWLGRRLPTDDEWQWAAHGGPRDTRFPWGDEPRERECTGRGSLGSCLGGLFDDATPEGVHDLIGNIAEWTRGADKTGGLRGGSFRDSPDREREAGVADDTGFRCAADLHAATAPAPRSSDIAAQRDADDNVERFTRPAFRKPPARPLAHLTLLAREPAQATRWTELESGIFIPFAPDDPAAFGLAAPLDRSRFPSTIVNCVPLRGLLTTIVVRCDAGQIIALERDTFLPRWVSTDVQRSSRTDIGFAPRHFVSPLTYTYARENDAYAGYSLASGRRLWRTEARTPARTWLDDARGYIVEPTRLTAYDLADGHILWSVQRSYNCPVASGDGMIILEDPTGYRPVDPATGALGPPLADPPTNCVTRPFRSHKPRIAAGRLFVFDLPVPDALRARDLTGAELWRSPDFPTLLLAADHDAVYVRGPDGLVVLDAATGTTALELSIEELHKVDVFHGAGAFGPLVLAYGRDETLILGRGPEPAVREEYTIRGRVPFSGNVWQIHVGPHAVDRDARNRFVVRGHSVVGDDLRLTVEIQPALGMQPYSAELVPMHRSGSSILVLDGRGTYDLGDLAPLFRPDPRHTATF